MDYYFMKQVFPNLESEVWEGNKPDSFRGYELIDGTHVDEWVTKYGKAETANGKIRSFSYKLNSKVEIFILYDFMQITDYRYAGKNDEWIFSSKGSEEYIRGVSKYNVHNLEPELAEKYLCAIPETCELLRLFKAQATEMYQSSNNMKVV